MTQQEFMTILNSIAAKNHTTPIVVFHEIEIAITYAYENGTPEQKARLMSIPHKNKIPSPYEVIANLSQNLSKSSCVASSLYPL